MTPEHIGNATLYLGDCLDVMATLPDSSSDLIIADPPYWSTGKAEVGDKQWRSAADYLAWLDAVLVAFARILKPNGSLYLFCFDDMSDRVSVLVRDHLSVLNHIVWMKSQGWHHKAEKSALRAYLSPTERIIFAEHCGSDNTAMGSAGYDTRCDELRGFVFEPLRAYLDGERKRAGIDKADCNAACGFSRTPGGMASRHYFSRSQWCLPTQAHYAALRRLFNAQGGAYLRREYDDLRREYDDLRREYDDLRRPFTVSAEVPYTDVWDFPTVAHYPGKHPCEKPYAMLEHIVRASSRPGAVVLDPFVGSGVSGLASLLEGRRFIGIERDASYYNIAKRRIADACAQPRLVG